MVPQFIAGNKSAEIGNRFNGFPIRVPETVETVLNGRHFSNPAINCEANEKETARLLETFLMISSDMRLMSDRE